MPPARKKRIVAADKLNWKAVPLPERLDDAEGFYGLEEIDNVEVLRDEKTRKIQFKAVVADSDASEAESEWEKVQLSVTLIAKLPYRDGGESDRMMVREGTNYALMPHYLSDATQGYIQTKPIQQPQPCSAVVPKFYGLYQNREGKLLMLMEECGKQVRESGLKPDHWYV